MMFIKENPRFLYAVVFFLTFISACKNDHKNIEEKKGAPLIWEEIALGISDDVFYAKTKSLLKQKEDITLDKNCNNQPFMGVYDLDKKEIIERSAGKHSLKNCLVKVNNQSSLVEIRAEFIDEKLCNLSFRLSPKELPIIKQNMEKRFGNGSSIVLKKYMLLDTQNIDFQYWSNGKELWLLSQGESNTVSLSHFDMITSSKLPHQAKASVKGKPVSLKDLGIGDYNANDPALTMEIPDSGIKKDKEIKAQ